MKKLWWQALHLREEVRNNAGRIDDVQMSLYRAIYGRPRAPYGACAYYGAITHPTATLAALIGRVAVRLGAGDHYSTAGALYHLHQGMGGGKSHGLIGLYHMGNSPREFASTDIGRMAFDYAAQMTGENGLQLDGTRVVVLGADNMTPFVPDDSPEMDGPAKSLWERFLWRLVARDYNLFIRFKDRWDQERIIEALSSVGRPVLILVDEIMDYVRQLDDARYADRRNSEMAFLKALFDAVNDVPNVAMVVVMISTENDRAVYGIDAQRLRDELQSYIVRNGTTTAVTEAADFSQIIRRRLFEDSPPVDAISHTAARFLDTTPQWKAKFSGLHGFDEASFPAAIARSYPFHPELLRLVETEWSSLAGYQRVRSTISLFAQTVYVWSERATDGKWVPELIGTGDLPLEHSGIREALLNSGLIESETTNANFRQIIPTDIVSEGGLGGFACELDRSYRDKEHWCAANPRAAQRMATALLLYSLAPRPGGKTGATEAEVLAASFVPEKSYAFTDAETIFNALQDPQTGLTTIDRIAGVGGQAPRYYLATRQTLQMLAREQRNAVTEEDRDAQVADVAERLATKGPGFNKIIFVRNEFDSHGQQRPSSSFFTDLDETNATRLAVLDPSRWSLLNGRDDETREAIRGAFGVGAQPLAVTHAASLVIACANTQRRNQARQRAAEYLAWARVANLPHVHDDPGRLAEANIQVSQAKAALDREVKRAFQHFTYLVRDAEDKLEVKFDKFEQDDKTSLSGAHVWDALVAAGRAVTPGGLTLQGLMLSIMNELPLTLRNLTSRFWTNPRFPMLSGEQELQRTLFSALHSGQLQLVNANDIVVPTPEHHDQLPLNSSTVTARIPTAPTSEVQSHDEPSGQPVDPGSVAPTDSNVGPSDEQTSTRSQLWMKTQADLSDDVRRENMMVLLKRLANMADQGILETIIITTDLIGETDHLTNLIAIAERVPGTQKRLENLPD